MRKIVSGLPHSTALSWSLLKDLIDVEELKKAPALILVPNNLWAYNIRDDLETLAPHIKFYFLPALETDLLRNRGPSVGKRVERIQFLSSLSLELYKKSPSVYLISVEALNQKIPRQSFWQEHSLSIKVGQEYSRTDLADRLARIGYTPAELVEQPAEYAVRGSILDVYSPLLDYPVRFELFEDVVQTVRLFHPESQRRLSDLQEVLLPPAREFLYTDDPKKVDKTRQELRQILDNANWDKQDREALLGRISQQSYFPSVDYWGSILDPDHFGEIADVFNSAPFSPGANIFSVEPHAIDLYSKSYRKEMERNFLTGFSEGEWVPPCSYFSSDETALNAFLNQFLSSSSWYTLRHQSALANEPTQKTTSVIHTHNLLIEKLNIDRQSDAELPLKHLAEEVKAWGRSHVKTIFLASNIAQLERLNFLLAPYNVHFKVHQNWADAVADPSHYSSCPGLLGDGFSDPDAKIVVLLEEQIFGTKKKRSSHNKITSSRSGMSAFSNEFALFDLKPNDLVVSREHGIGRYLGLKTMNFGNVPAELLEIEYKDNAKLFIPVTRLHTIQKHSGASEQIALDKLGGNTWETKKSKVKRHLQSLAGDLLHLYSLRAMARGPEIKPSERIVEEFAATFPFNETPDQAKAIADALKDMRGPRPMDRLVCGDVGYGKTEVAIRTAHAAVACGFQVVVLCPTTILAAQHESTFKKRFSPLGITVRGMSRFKSAKEVKETLALAKENKCHIIVGTHRLLGQDFTLPNPGLLVIDEEQRFGVAHKEKIRKLKTNIHVLSMTATPIPRTLNMAMGGLKDLSIISTPPQDRLSVRTHVVRKKEALIKDAIEFEIKRGGQIFYVHNRVQTIPKEFEMLRSLTPSESKVAYVHGQMDEEDIEKKMMDFYEGRTDVLLATSIIESGLDVPNANTLIVDRSDAFGLAQLYQIRGRVGRSNQRAYAYFLIPEQGKITQDAEERLSVLEAYQELGSGFHIASHDLEIRGSGDIIGRDQSGHISAIGFEAYTQLLEECVAEIKGETLAHKIDPEIQLGIDTTIPETYIPEIGLRLVFYRRLAAADDEHEIENIEHEMEDRFGLFPESVKNLAASMRIKCQLRRLGVSALTAGKNGFSVAFDASTVVDPKKMVRAVQKYPAHFQMNPDGRLLLKRVSGEVDPQKIMRGVEAALSEVESWIG